MLSIFPRLIAFVILSANIGCIQGYVTKYINYTISCDDEMTLTYRLYNLLDTSIDSYSISFYPSDCVVYMTIINLNNTNNAAELIYSYCDVAPYSNNNGCGSTWITGIPKWIPSMSPRPRKFTIGIYKQYPNITTELKNFKLTLILSTDKVNSRVNITELEPKTGRFVDFSSVKANYSLTFKSSTQTNEIIAMFACDETDVSAVNGDFTDNCNRILFYNDNNYIGMERHLFDFYGNAPIANNFSSLTIYQSYIQDMHALTYFYVRGNETYNYINSYTMAFRNGWSYLNSSRTGANFSAEVRFAKLKPNRMKFVTYVNASALCSLYIFKGFLDTDGKYLPNDTLVYKIDYYIGRVNLSLTEPMYTFVATGCDISYYVNDTTIPSTTSTTPSYGGASSTTRFATPTTKCFPLLIVIIIISRLFSIE